MKPETYKKCLEIALSFKQKQEVEITTKVFKEVMVYTLHKMAKIRHQLEDCVDSNDYIPLLFEDCLREHYMFAMCNAMQKGGAKVEPTV